MSRFFWLSFVCFVSFVVCPLGAQQVAFVPHDINPASEFPACAVMDVNKDGKLDIKDQAKFADGLKGIATSLDKLSQSGNDALKTLEEGDVGKAMSKQASCKSSPASAPATAS